jgi:hypothetical protein
MVPEEHFNRAFHRAFHLVAELNAVEVIWANECFELLLHFCFRNTAIGRHQLPDELSRGDRLGKKYA